MPEPEPTPLALLRIALRALGGALLVTDLAVLEELDSGDHFTIDQSPENHGWIIRLRGPNAPKPGKLIAELQAHPAQEANVMSLSWTEVALEGPGSEGCPV
jgi:hypothetical protein